MFNFWLFIAACILLVALLQVILFALMLWLQGPEKSWRKVAINMPILEGGLIAIKLTLG